MVCGSPLLLYPSNWDSSQHIVDFFSCPCVWCRLCYVLCSLSTKNLPTMQFMPLIITSQCKLSVKIANALSCVCQEFLSLAEQLLCQVLVGAYLFPGNTPCIRSSYASFWFWFGKVRSRANIFPKFDFLRTKCFYNSVSSFHQPSPSPFLHCLFNSSLFQHHLSANPCLSQREHVLGPKRKDKAMLFCWGLVERLPTPRTLKNIPM